MRLGINENTIFQCDLVDFLSACSSAGIYGVEISCTKLSEAMRFIPAEDIVRQCKKSGIEILTLNAFEDAILVPDSNMKSVIAETRLIGELCRAVNCPAVVGVASRWYPRYGPLPVKIEITRIYQKRLIELQSVLAEYDVRLMFEPIDYPEFNVGDVPWVNEILCIPELSNMGVVPDIHNMHHNGHGPRQLENLRNPIGIFHLDDTQSGDLQSLHVATSRAFPGEGVADALTWVRTVLDSGYSGYFSLELFDDAIYAMEPQEAARLCREKMEAFAEKV